MDGIGTGYEYCKHLVLCTEMYTTELTQLSESLSRHYTP